MDIVSRKEAQENGLKYYFTGKECKRGHLSKRQTTDCSCYEYKKVLHRSYYKKRPEYYLSKTKQWAEKNPDYYVNHTREWRKTNPDKLHAQLRKYFLSKKRAVPIWADDKEITEIYKLARIRGLQVDHIVPITSEHVCGLHTQDNLRCISAELNAYKGNRYWPDMSKE